MGSAEASKKYAQSEKGKSTRKKIRESKQNKDLQKRWRDSGGAKREYERNKDKYRDTYMKRVYGISLDEYNKKIEQQQGVCYICESSPSGGKSLAIDHCHDTGIIRKLLCINCNTVLGLVKEDINIMNKLINYIEEHR